nr:hypothetical protein [Tanacetum cinerariifolium]
MSIEIRKKEKLLQEEQWAYLSTHPYKRLHSFCFDDDDEDHTSAITPNEPVLSTEEPDNSLSMGDEHLDTIPVMESDEFIKSGVENLIPIPSESEGTPEHVCDVPSHDNSSPLNVSKDQIEDFFESNKEFSSIDDDSFFIDDINYVEASPPDLSLSAQSSGSTTTSPDLSLPEYEAFHDDHVKEFSSGSPTTHSDSPLYDSFMFDLSINSFPPADRSASYEFTDELIPFISAPDVYLVEQRARNFSPIRSPMGIGADLGEHLAPMERPDKISIRDQGGFEAWFANRVWGWRVVAPLQMDEDDEISNLVDPHIYMFYGGWKWQDLLRLALVDHHRSSGPHDTQYCVENLEQAFVDCTSVTPPDKAWMEYVSGGVTLLRISSTKHKERPLRT